MTETSATHRLAVVVGTWIVCGALWACGAGPSARPAGERFDPANPADVLAAYATALEEGRLKDAWAMAEPGSAGAFDSFAARYADPALRRARAAELRAAARELRPAGAGVRVVERAQGDAWVIVDQPDKGAREALEQFLSAAERGDFRAAYTWLSSEWRAQYTPQRLAQDFEGEPLAKQRLARARAALAGEAISTAGGVQFVIGDDKAVRLVREGDAFRVAALE